MLEPLIERALSNVQLLVWYADLDEAGRWQYRYLSPLVAALTGYPLDYFRQGLDRWGSIVHPADRAAWDQALVRLRQGQPSRMEYRLVRPDGSCRRVSEDVQVEADAHGCPARFAGSVTDVTDRQRTAQENQLLQALMLAIPEASDGRAALALALRKVCETTGWPVGEAWVPSADGSCLECSPAWHAGLPGLEAFRAASTTLTFASGVGLPGRVWATRRPYWIADLARDPDFRRPRAAAETGLQAAFAIPVLAGDALLAVVVFFAGEPRSEDESLMRMVAAVVAQVGVVLKRKQAELALDHERHLLQTLLDNVPDCIYFKDAAGRFVRINRAVAQRFGLTDPSQALGKSDFDFFHPSAARAFQADEQAVYRSRGRLIAKEEKETWPDGSVTWASTTTLPMADASGQLVGVFGISRDVTDRKRVEEELRAGQERLERLVAENVRLLAQARQAEQKYRAIFEHATEGIFQTTPEGRYLTANPALARMHGSDSPEELIRNVTDIGNQLYVDPARRADFKQLMEEQGAVRDFQFEARRRDGSTVWFSENVRAVRDANGTLLYYEGTAEDISERKRAEEALRASEARYQAVVENLALSVFLKDGAFRFIAVNQPFCRNVGRAEAAILGATDFDLYPAAMAEKYRAADERVLREGQRLELEEETLIEGRLRTVHTVKTPVRDGAGRIIGLVGSFWDVTDQRHLESQLRQAHKMEAVGQLAAGVAHDFNNLLTAILGNLTLAAADPAIDAPTRAWLHDAEKAGARAAELTQQLLSFTRQAVLRLEPTDLGASIQEVVGLLRRAIDPRIRVVVRTPPDLWPVQADPGQMIQVLMNLCLNARDAMPDGGEIVLSAANVPVDAEYARLHLDARPGDFVGLRVADTGPGIPPEVRQRIFEPFFTTKGPGKGTGLGLAIVYGIVRQHQGWINCASEPGQGTRFDIFLPRHAGHAVPPRVPTPAQVAPGQGETVLLVDDEPLIRNLGRAILQRSGYRVLLAEDGLQALEMYRGAPDSIDLVLLDLSMPRLSGRDTLRQLRLIRPTVRAVLSSGYSPEQVEMTRDEDTLGFVTKPYHPQELARAVRAALDAVVGRP